MGKLDLRPRYMQELNKYTMYMGYKVTEAGVVYNCRDKLVKPKFLFKGKRIDYVYIDVTYEGKKRRISYHRFIYMAFNPDFEDDPNMVVTTVGRRFDYRLSNLKLMTRQEHLQQLAKQGLSYSEVEQKEVAETYEEIKDYMTKKEYAKRLGISPRTLYSYLKRGNYGV